MMVSSLKELKDSLSSVDNTIFAVHVNKDKNELSSWIEKEIDSDFGKSMMGLKQKI